MSLRCGERPYPHLPLDTAEVQRLGDHRTLERQECIRGDELWNEVKPDGAGASFLGERVLREHRRFGREDNPGIHPQSGGGGSASGRVRPVESPPWGAKSCHQFTGGIDSQGCRWCQSPTTMPAMCSSRTLRIEWRGLGGTKRAWARRLAQAPRILLTTLPQNLTSRPTLKNRAARIRLGWCNLDPKFVFTLRMVAAFNTLYRSILGCRRTRPTWIVLAQTDVDPCQPIFKLRPRFD